MGYNDAVVIELSQVPCELICAICHELISNPLQTRCNHVFCAECITPAVNANFLCPIDRSQLSVIGLTPIKFANPILYRIWNKLKLRCPYAVPNSCHWTGSPDSFEAHMSACASSQGSVISQDTITKHSNTTEAEDKIIISNLKNAVIVLNREKSAHLSDLSTQTNATLDVARLYHIKQEENRALSQGITSMRGIVHPNYDYNIMNTEVLSELIFQDRDGCPYGVDRNRIYQCITNIVRTYGQNSDYYQEQAPNVFHNMLMLLAIASASSWFTVNQRNNLQNSLSEYA